MYSKLSIVAGIQAIFIAISAHAAANDTELKKVKFLSNGIELAGHLYLPPAFDKNRKYSAIICVPPAGAVKEQTSGLYAGRLAEKGFVTLAYDASNTGESGGEPRQSEDPFARMEDIHSAVDYLTTLPFVDENKIGALGICAGGGYVMGVTPTERRIRAAAGVSTADIGSNNRDGWLGNASRESQIEKLEAVGRQRTLEARGADKMYHPIMPDSLDGIDKAALVNPALKDLDMKGDAKSTFPNSFVEAWEYYRTPRAAHPRSVNRMLFVSTDKKMLFSAINPSTPIFTQPALFIVGSRADSRRHSEAIYHAIPTREKEIFVIDGASHVDLYDREPYVAQAVNKLTSFYNIAFSGNK